MRKPVSSRWRTFASATRSPMTRRPAAALAPSFRPRRRCWPNRSAARRRDRSALARSDPRGIEIDRRRLDALAILGGRDHAIGKRRLGHAAAIFAAVNRGLMLGDHERALGKIEHLALLDPRGRPRIERRTAMAACARLVPNHAIGIGDLQQSAALVAGLAAAGLARAAA